MNKSHRIGCVIGTRPEALKMAPIINALSHEKNIQVNTILTAQHRSLLDQILMDFNIKVTADFNIMTENQQLSELTAKILNKFSLYLKDNPCDLIIAQGDTTTTMVSALVAFYHKIPFAHVEAGLRTRDTYNPFPEELNRRIVSKIATLHFCPTEVSKQNLEKENITQGVFVTGNTIIDTLYAFTKNLKPVKKTHQKTILVTCHRRENFGEPLKNISLALINIVKNNLDANIIFPVHPNPNVKKIVYENLDQIERIQLTAPLNYLELTTILSQCFLVLTDSGGLQEEAPALQKPVLILRNETERPEGVTCGAAKIVGTDTHTITTTVTELLTNPALYQKMSSAGSPYGDGHASKKIRDIIFQHLKNNENIYIMYSN